MTLLSGLSLMLILKSTILQIWDNDFFLLHYLSYLTLNPQITKLNS